MTSSFVLTLDTVTHVTATINGGAESTQSSNVTLELGLDADALEMKVWGTIDPDDPMNAGLAQTEEEAPWISPEAVRLVALEAGEGMRRLQVRVRDDVLNEATATATIFIGVPSPPPAPSPRPAGPMPPAPLRRERRQIEARSRLRVRGHGRAAAHLVAAAAVTSSSTASIRASTSSLSGVQTETAGAVRARLRDGSSLATDTTWKLGKRPGDEMQAITVLLL